MQLFLSQIGLWKVLMNPFVGAEEVESGPLLLSSYHFHSGLGERVVALLHNVFN